jgi:hypothetical protein
VLSAGFVVSADFWLSVVDVPPQPVNAAEKAITNTSKIDNSLFLMIKFPPYFLFIISITTY